MWIGQTELSRHASEVESLCMSGKLCLPYPHDCMSSLEHAFASHKHSTSLTQLPAVALALALSLAKP